MYLTYPIEKILSNIFCINSAFNFNAVCVRRHDVRRHDVRLYAVNDVYRRDAEEGHNDAGGADSDNNADAEEEGYNICRYKCIRLYRLLNIRHKRNNHHSRRHKRSNR